MSEYAQPDFYKFNEDSLRLVRFIKARTEKVVSILDLGAGSGVIGIELSRHLQPKTLTLLEIQQEFIPYLEQNKSFVPGPTEVQILNQSFAQFKPSESYDLVVCNPPYFLPGHGERPKDPQREIARSFVREDWRNLLECIHRSLQSEGRAWLVVKNDQRILNLICHVDLHKTMYRDENLIYVELSRLNKN